MRYFSLLLIFFLLLSCAQTGKKRSSTKTYSADVEKSFEEIEKEKAIELYKKLRWDNWKKIQRKRKALRRPKVTRKKTRYYKKRKVVKRKKPAKPALGAEKVKELQIEISQNMSFFCMAKRKDSRFKNENDCHAFTQNVLDSCQDKVGQPWVDRSIINCVKRKLR